MEETLKIISELNITEEESAVLACSYGPDSMVLLDILLKENINIIVAHVNHKLRKESDEEALLLKDYCQKNNIIFETTSIDKNIVGNIESNTREIRYNFFEDTLKKYNSKYLFTAHHGDDLIETVMMRLIRGSSFKGYAGFNLITNKKDYYLVRPLIYYTKDEILTYAKNNNIPYAIDHTNNEDDYTRNRIRHHILPELKKENKKVHQKFLKFNELINTYEDYFNKETTNIYNKLYIENTLNINEFNLLAEIFQKRLLEKILLFIYQKNINLINDTHIQLLMNLISNNKQNSYVVLPKNVKVMRFYNTIEFNFHEEINDSYDYTFKEKVELKDCIITRIEKTDIAKSNDILRLDSREITLPLHVRTKKVGDKISVKNLNGSKKINEIFIDNKVAMKKRNSYPIVTDNEGIILWIPSLKKSKFDKQINETYDIILKNEKKEKTNETQK